MGEFNIEAFDQLCKDSGYKFGKLAEMMGMPDSTFRNKRKGKSEWTRSEMSKARTVLKMDAPTFNKIFCFVSR